MNTNHTNPYVGPRTFRRDEGHLFHGRDREARDLLSLVVSEQLVLFYAQSGAGKSSLINTRLIPSLEAKNYEVLPVGRVSGEAHEGVEATNIYVFNLLRSLIQQDVSAQALSSLTLDQFLAGLKKNETGYFYEDVASEADGQAQRRKLALIIDQFEEIFTTHPEAWEKRGDFFAQVAEAMEKYPHLWVVLVMREDYIAYLDPYAHLLPNGLRVRYYMQRLSREAAVQAMKKPVEKVRPYEPGVAETLVQNLASIKVIRTDGIQDVQPGQYVEPVQLQVVCYSLWENLPSEGDRIKEQDLLEVGDVDQSLERYYAGRVAAVADQKNISERLIREWFENELITPSGTRNIVLQNENRDGMRDDVIQTLLGDLVRAEVRSGQVWYELSHDRLIEPVRKNNRAWFEQNLSVFQRQAGLWIQQGRSEGLLLRGTELQKAEEEVQGMELTAEEQAYLRECRALRTREQRDTNQRRMIFAALVVSLLLLVAAGFFWGQARVSATQAEQNAAVAATSAADAQIASDLALANAREAELQKAQAEAESRRALAGQLALEAKSVVEQYSQRAQLLGLEALQVNLDAGEETNPIAEEALRAANARVTGMGLPGFPMEVSFLQFTKDNQWLFAGSTYSGDFRAWKLQEMNQTGYRPIEIHFEHTENDSVEAFLSDQEKWLVLTKKGIAMGPGTIIPGSTETRLFWRADLSSRTDPIVLEHPVVTLDNSNAVLELLEDQVLLWRFDPNSISEKESFALEGAYLALSADRTTLATTTTISNRLTINFWKVDSPGSVTAQSIDRFEFTADRGHLYAQATPHWLAVIEVFPESTTLHLFDMHRPEEPVEVHIPAASSYYSLQSSPHGTWLKVGLSNEECVCGEVDAYFFNVENRSPVLSESVRLEFDNGFLLDGWYAYRSEEYWESDLAFWTYSLENLRDQDSEVDLSHTFSTNGDYYPFWKLVTDESGTWLSLGDNDALNADILSSEGRLSTRAPTATGLQQIGTNEDPWESITRMGFEDGVVKRAVSSDQQWYAEGSYGGSLRLWNLQEERTYQAGPFASENTGDYMSISSDGQWLATGSGLWHLEEGRPSALPVRFSSLRVYDAVFSPDAKWLLFSTYDNNGIPSLRLIDLEMFPLDPVDSTMEIDISGIDPYKLSFGPDSRWLIAWGGTTTALWNLGDRQESPSLFVPEGLLSQVAFTPEGKYVVGVRTSPGGDDFAEVETWGSQVWIWEIPQQSGQVSETRKFTLDQASILSPDGYSLFAQDRTLWDLRCIIENASCEAFPLDLPNDSFGDVTFYWGHEDIMYAGRYSAYFSQDGRYLFVEGNPIKAWDLQASDASGQFTPLLVYDAPSNSSAFPVRFAPAIVQQITREISLGGGGGGGGGGGPGSYKIDYGIELIRPAKEGKDLQSLILRGHEEFAGNGLVSPSGRWGITISADSIKLWDLEAVLADPFAPPVNLPLQTSDIAEYGFTMDERFLVVLLDNRELQFHPMRVEDLIAQACRSVGRNFIINEWQRYFQSAPYERTCENLPEHPSVQIEAANTP